MTGFPMQLKRFLSAVFAAGLCLDAASHAHAVLLDFEQFNLPQADFPGEQAFDFNIITLQGITIDPQPVNTANAIGRIWNSAARSPTGEFSHVLSITDQKIYEFSWSGQLQEVTFDFAFQPVTTSSGTFPGMAMGLNINGELIHFSGVLVGLQDILNVGDVPVGGAVVNATTSTPFINSLGLLSTPGRVTIRGPINSLRFQVGSKNSLAVDNMLFNFVPEPASAALLLAGAAALLRRRSRC